MNLLIKSEDEYEDLLGLWADLESGLGMVLGHPGCVPEFLQRILQYDQWLQNLLERDTDLGLYLLFQLTIHSPVGYSASHALVCAVLCHLIALDFAMPQPDRDGLVHAAMTMNIAMTRLQDTLSTQRGRPTSAQQAAIKTHAADSTRLLGRMGVSDALWLNTILLHHQDEKSDDLADTVPAPLISAHHLARILRTVDRYAAMISPRQSREGRSAAESARSILRGNNPLDDDVGAALVRIVGQCPPGTFVQLDDNQVAIVTRRSDRPNLPDVAIVMDGNGIQVKPPRLHATAIHAHPAIRSALTAAAVPEHINHHLILQLGQPPHVERVVR